MPPTATLYPNATGFTLYYLFTFHYYHKVPPTAVPTTLLRVRTVSCLLREARLRL